MKINLLDCHQDCVGGACFLHQQSIASSFTTPTLRKSLANLPNCFSSRSFDINVGTLGTVVRVDGTASSETEMNFWFKTNSSTISSVTFLIPGKHYHHLIHMGRVGDVDMSSLLSHRQQHLLHSSAGWRNNPDSMSQGQGRHPR